MFYRTLVLKMLQGIVSMFIEVGMSYVVSLSEKCLLHTDTLKPLISLTVKRPVYHSISLSSAKITITNYTSKHTLEKLI